VLVPQIAALKAGGNSGGVTYNNALTLLMDEVLPNGLLGVALAGLLASFMAGMAANVSSLNTVFTYDLWQDWIRPGRSDRYYLQVGRLVTVVGCVLAIGAAFLAGSYSNITDYIQALFSFFNAPLFAIFILGLFWKRMTGTAGWTGLIAGTVAAIVVDVLVRTHVLSLSSQAGSFVGAAAAFVVGVAVSVGVSMVTQPKPDAELVGLTWSLTPRESRDHANTGEDAGWYRSPVTLGVIVLVLIVVLYIVV
jgi:SSS family solute:Na+ symporter